MKITKWSVDINEMELTNYAYREIKKEETEAFLWVFGIFFGVMFFAPTLFINIVFDIIKWESPMMVEMLICMILLIITGLGTFIGSAKAIYFFKMLKHKNLHELVAYLYDKDGIYPYITVCYILLCKEFHYAYTTEDNGLVIVYYDDGKPCMYQLYDYDELYMSDDNVTLTVTRQGVKLISYEGGAYSISCNSVIDMI